MTRTVYVHLQRKVQHENNRSSAAMTLNPDQLGTLLRSFRKQIDHIY